MTFSCDFDLGRDPKFLVMADTRFVSDKPMTFYYDIDCGPGT